MWSSMTKKFFGCGQVEKLVNTCDEQIPTINANLLVAQSMCNKILDQAKNSELD